jgi:hypothetical protein
MMVGLGSYESGILDTIKRMLEEGTLPSGETCAESGRATRDFIRLVVLCERLYTAADRHSGGQAAWILGIWGLVWTMGHKQDPKVYGRDTVVTIPLRLCREYHRKLAGWGTQRKFRRLLRTVPVYARLLEEYPSATIQVDATLPDAKDVNSWDLDEWP